MESIKKIDLWKNHDYDNLRFFIGFFGKEISFNEKAFPAVTIADKFCIFNRKYIFA